MNDDNFPGSWEYTLWKKKVNPSAGFCVIIFVHRYTCDQPELGPFPHADTMRDSPLFIDGWTFMSTAMWKAWLSCLNSIRRRTSSTIPWGVALGSGLFYYRPSPAFFWENNTSVISHARGWQSACFKAAGIIPGPLADPRFLCQRDRFISHRGIRVVHQPP